MNPAASLIVFTVLSGAGLGLIALLGIGLGPGRGAFVPAAAMAGLVLTVTGGLASVGHLARPDRGWRAFSQWRSSWLSREACLLMITCGTFTAYAFAWIFADTRLWPLGWLSAALALATVHCTAMIYAQLRTVPRWSVAPTPALFLAFGLLGGILAHQAIAGLTGAPTQRALLLVVLLVTAGIAVWWQTEAAGARMWVEGTTLGTATGLGARGSVRAFEAPHTGRNYLLDEMAYRVGRRRAWQLRRLGAVLGFVVPTAAVLLSWPVGDWLLLPAFVAHVAGVSALRWLFFAEAEHVQALYYGAGN